MIQDTVPDFPCQIQSPASFFQLLHNSDTLFLMGKTFTENLIQCPLPGMTERRMSQIMSKCDGLCQIFIQPQRTGNRPCRL